MTTQDELLDYLFNFHFSSGRDHDLIKEFIHDFFENYPKIKQERNELFCKENGHCLTWMPKNQSACVRCGIIISNANKSNIPYNEDSLFRR